MFTAENPLSQHPVFVGFTRLIDANLQDETQTFPFFNKGRHKDRDLFLKI
jgi:hypothetical protein